MSFQFTDEQHKKIAECANAIDQLSRQRHTNKDFEIEIECLFIEFAGAIFEVGYKQGTIETAKAVLEPKFLADLICAIKGK